MDCLWIVYKEYKGRWIDTRLCCIKNLQGFCTNNGRVMAADSILYGLIQAGSGNAQVAHFSDIERGLQDGFDVIAGLR